MLRIAVVLITLLLSACQSPKIINFDETLTNSSEVSHLDNTRWKLDVLLSRGVLDQAQMHIQFEKGMIFGFSGCNQFKGPYLIEKGTLIVDKVSTTRKLCSQTVNAFEDNFLYQIQSQPQIRFSASGAILLVNEQTISRFVKE